MTYRKPEKIKCLLVDDEEPAHEVLRYFIGKIPWLETAGSCYNVIDASKAIPEVNPGVIFLDINLPELSGLELLKILRLDHTPVILTSAYAEYAVDGFACDVTSFLLKPIRFELFLKAATKIKLIHDQQTGYRPAGYMHGMHHTSADDGHLWIRADKKLLCLRFGDIFAIEGNGDYVKFYCADEVITSRCSLSTVSEKLTSPVFIKTHRSYIVNRNAIKQIDGKIITTLNGIKLPIASKNGHHDIIQRIIS